MVVTLDSTPDVKGVAVTVSPAGNLYLALQMGNELYVRTRC